MKNRIISLLKYIITFIILIGCFNALLYLVCSFSSKSLRSNAISSYNFLSKQGMFYQTSKVLNLYNNNCTEAVIINEAYSVDNNNPYESYMKVRKNYNKKITNNEILEPTGEGVSINYDVDTEEEIYNTEYDPIGELGDFLNGDIHSSVVYGRYWHGYLVLYRPLLTFLNIKEIKTFQVIVFSVLFCWLLFLLYKRFGKIIALIFGMSLACTGYFTASYSLESTPVFLVMLVSSIILLIRLDKIKNFNLYLFIVGCITNFFDYLTVPLITLGVLCSIYYLKLFEEKKDWKYCLKNLFISSFIWGLGYGLTWISKWALYDLTIHDGNNMLSIGFTQSMHRMQRTSEKASATYVFRIINILKTTTLYTMISFIILLFINKFKVVSNGLNKKVLPFLCISLYPVIWYVVLANHTIIHYYFVYRHSLLFMLGILLFLYKLMFKNSK